MKLMYRILTLKEVGARGHAMSPPVRCQAMQIMLHSYFQSIRNESVISVTPWHHFIHVFQLLFMYLLFLEWSLLAFKKNIDQIWEEET